MHQCLAAANEAWKCQRQGAIFCSRITFHMPSTTAISSRAALQIYGAMLAFCDNSKLKA